MNALLDWSVRLLILTLCIYWWHRTQKYGAFRWGALAASMIVAFGMALGEGYFLLTGKLPWFFGLEQIFSARDDAGPAALLVISGIVMWWFTSWILSKPTISDWWNRSSWVPGKISRISISGIGLALTVFIASQASANLCKSHGFTWGMNVVAMGGNIAADAAELGQGENDKLQDDLDKARLKTKRKDPVQHRNTGNAKTNGR